MIIHCDSLHGVNKQNGMFIQSVNWHLQPLKGYMTAYHANLNGHVEAWCAHESTSFSIYSSCCCNLLIFRILWRWIELLWNKEWI